FLSCTEEKTLKPVYGDTINPKDLLVE
ncbi:hypothetical protein, partial [Acinetobacter baumannii]